MKENFKNYWEITKEKFSHFVDRGGGT